MSVNQAFIDFLAKTPERLAQFVNIVNEFYKLQNTAPAAGPAPDGPKTFHAGESHALTTVGISHADLDAMSKGYAEGVVKEKAIEFIKGFISGVMIAS